MTLGMIKEAPPAARLDLFNILVRTWNGDETAEFETSTRRAGRRHALEAIRF